MPDLSTTYLGLQLRNPLVVSASPLSKRLDTIRRLQDEGAAAIVLYSLFEEQITRESLALDRFLTHTNDSSAEALSYFPDLDHYNLTPDLYLQHLRRVKAAIDIPVIASLNGISTGGWIEYAQKIQDAGADALELNLYFVPTDADLSAGELEDAYVELVHDIRARITIPLALKLSPFFTSLPHVTRRFVAAGANSLVLFNRFYQPDFDLEALEVVPSISLSTSSDLRLPLRWIAMLYGRIDADLALTGGVHTADDVLKAMMAGAKVVLLASELLQHGVQRIGDILIDLQTWMDAYEYTSIREMQGSMSQRAVAEPAAFERATYLKALNTYDLRVL